MNIEKNRLVKACVLVFGLIAFVPLSSFLEAEESLHTESSSQKTSSLSLRDHAFALLAEGEMGHMALPSWFSEELFFIEGARGYADEGSGVFALICESGLEELTNSVTAQMRERGWERGGDGASAHLSFSRAAGQPRSVAMNFTEVAGCTTVVVQVLG